jgi:hypothetical protein
MTRVERVRCLALMRRKRSVEASRSRREKPASSRIRRSGRVTLIARLPSETDAFGVFGGES